VLGETRGRPALGLALELLRLVAPFFAEARQDRLAQADAPGAAHRDLDGALSASGRSAKRRFISARLAK
jgi:hypothetical protein